MAWSYTTGESSDLWFYMEEKEIISVGILSVYVYTLWPSKFTSSNFPRDIIGECRQREVSRTFCRADYDSKELQIARFSLI